MSRKTVMTIVLLGLVLAGCTGTAGNAVTTYDGSACVYEGPVEFDLDLTVNFGFVNESDTTNMGFSVWKVPEEGTADEILEVVGGISEPVEGQAGFLRALSPPTIRGGTTILTVTLDTPGQYALICSDFSTEKDYANLLTVLDS